MSKPIKAIAVFTENIKGTVIFTEIITEKLNVVRIDVNISGLKPDSLHGFHVHEAGDLTDKCMSMCAHFNPFNKTHGGPDSVHRHVGDLGNLFSYGEETDTEFNLYAKDLSLVGRFSVIGRALIVHEDADDLGKTNNPLSKTTGNSGSRIACGVIGISSLN